MSAPSFPYAHLPDCGGARLWGAEFLKRVTPEMEAGFLSLPELVAPFEGPPTAPKPKDRP